MRNICFFLFPFFGVFFDFIYRAYEKIESNFAVKREMNHDFKIMLYAFTRSGVSVRLVQTAIRSIYLSRRLILSMISSSIFISSNYDTISLYHLFLSEYFCEIHYQFIFLSISTIDTTEHNINPFSF